MLPKDVIANQLQNLNLSVENTDFTKAPQKEKEIKAKGKELNALAALSDGRFVSASDKTIELWDNSGNCVDTQVNDNIKCINAMVENSWGELEIASDDGIIKRWKLNGVRSQRLVNTEKKHDQPVTALAASHDGLLITGTKDGTIILWTVDESVKTINNHDNPITALVTFKDKRFASASIDGNIVLWNKNGKLISKTKAHTDRITVLAILPNGCLVSASYDSHIKIWNSDMKLVATLKGHAGRVLSLAVSPDGHIASCGYDNTIRLWDMQGKNITTIENKNCVSKLVFLADGRLASATSDNANISIWKFSSKKLAQNSVPVTHSEVGKPPAEQLQLPKPASVADQPIPDWLYKKLVKPKQAEVSELPKPASVATSPKPELVQPVQQGIIAKPAEVSRLPKPAAVAIQPKPEQVRPVQQEMIAKPAEVSQLPKPAAAAHPNAPILSASFVLKSTEFKYGAVLSQDGGYGIVYKGTLLPNTPVAIKKLKANSLSESALIEFTSEMSILVTMQLRSEHTVKLYGCCLESPYSMVMEYMEKGSLFRLLHSNEPLSWQQRYQIACDMANGIETLHHHNILHRDIKSLNVLLDKNLKAKWCDFGLAKVKSETRTMTNDNSLKGSLSWMAPERLNLKPHTKSSDIYSLGITFWELASRKLPYEAAGSNNALISNAIQNGTHDDIPVNCPPSFAKLIQLCWSTQPEQRPSAEAVSKALSEMKVEFDDEINSTRMSGPIYIGNF